MEAGERASRADWPIGSGDALVAWRPGTAGARIRCSGPGIVALLCVCDVLALVGNSVSASDRRLPSGFHGTPDLALPAFLKVFKVPF
ncbi:hypothetical protein GUJ93_ZPchr0006g46027 [Zizania palustris]|uniref:Uncharacterized protein n=1 Tax=Zizania palustris TaxID=103762 RepID=A0A8J5SHR4_ZIZPA|nr:hypothetical protein GUJ93_ZPchr0006g46027 [Zizania palustris]